MTSCNYCNDNPLLAKLGRCRFCLLLSFLLAFGCGLLWLWLDSSAAEAVERVAAAFGTLACLGLFVAHLLFGLYYRLTGQSGVFSSTPSEPEQ